jgi:hypothetical protein
VSLIERELVEHTQSFIGKNDVLTYGFAKGSYTPLYRDLMKNIIAEVDDRLTGIKFKRVKPRDADLIINHGELAPGTSGSAVWDSQGWEIRMPGGSSFSTTVFRHELGHVLGLGHMPMGSNSLMQPNMNGIYQFTGKDWRALESIWGKGQLFMTDGLLPQAAAVAP